MPQKNLILFGSFALDVTARELRKNGEFVTLPPKVMEFLVLLASRNGGVVEKQEIIEALWPDTVVEDGNLTQTAFLLRKAVEDSPSEPVFVLTVPRRGYRLGAIREESRAPETSVDGASASVVQPSLLTRKRLLAGSAVLLAVIAMLLVAWINRGSSQRGDAAAIRRLVVLPFVNMSPDADTEYLSDGLTEEIINELAGMEGLRVVARTTAFAFKGKPNDIRAIGKQLNVDAVLEGSVRKQGNRVRVTAQLNSVRDGYHYWSQTMEHDLKDSFALQKDIAARVARAVGRPGLVATTQPAQPVDTEARNLYLRGLFEARRVTDGALLRAIDLYRQAIAKSPVFPEAHAALADAYVDLGYSEMLRPEKAFEQARTHWSRALELNDRLPDAHTVKAMTILFYDRDFREAERAFQKAISLNPSFSEAHHWYSHCLMAMGRVEESLRESRLALETDVLSMRINAHLIWHYYMAGDYEKALATAESAASIDPNHGPARFYRQLALIATGRAEESAEISLRTNKSPDAPVWREALRTGGVRGYENARIESELRAKREGRPSSDVFLARRYLFLNRKAEALDALEAASKQRAPQIVYLKADPVYKPLHGEPRYERLVREVGIP